MHTCTHARVIKGVAAARVILWLVAAGPLAAVENALVVLWHEVGVLRHAPAQALEPAAKVGHALALAV